MKNPNLFDRFRSSVERFLTRTGILASDEESEYYAWADARLDELAAQAADLSRRSKERAERRANLLARGYLLVGEDEYCHHGGNPECWECWTTEGKVT